MEPVGALAVFGIGLSAGILSGLVGIGGGVLIVPFLYFYYATPAFSGVFVRPEVATVVAHATSLFVIVPTSLRGAFAFHRARLVEWRVVWPIGAASVVAAALGAYLATHLPSPVLKISFGALLLVSGYRLAFGRLSEPGESRRELRLGLPITVGVGAATGLLSALLGVGGGIVAIPLLLHVVGVEMRRVAATSIGIIVLTSIAGTVSYMLSAATSGLPEWSVGYVDVAVGVVMFLGSVLSVRLGTLLNQRLDARVLSLLFAAIFALIGARLIVTNLALA